MKLYSPPRLWVSWVANAPISIGIPAKAPAWFPVLALAAATQWSVALGKRLTFVLSKGTGVAGTAPSGNVCIVLDDKNQFCASYNYAMTSFSDIQEPVGIPPVETWRIGGAQVALNVKDFPELLVKQNLLTSVLLHEFGHVCDLDDENNPLSVENLVQEPFTDLQEDDREGAAAVAKLYPPKPHDTTVIVKPKPQPTPPGLPGRRA